MDDQAAAIGRRVRYWRQRRHLDRKQFADLVGRSVSWLDKIERGERNLLRLPMLEQVAEALSIEPAVLTDHRSARLAAQCTDAAEVQAIRQALGAYPTVSRSPAGGKPPTLARVRQQLAYVGHAWLSSHFTIVSQALPRLVTEAQLVAEQSRPADQVAAHRTLVMAYRLACSLLLKFDATDIAWLAADRALYAARATDDLVSLARATRSVGRAMSRGNQLPQTFSLLTSMADTLAPHLSSRSHDLLSLYGMLLLQAEITAARQEDPYLASTIHEQALDAANRFDRSYDDHETIFGKANVEVHRVAALVRLHESDRALAYAERIAPPLVAGLPVERRANFLLDLTEACTQAGRFPEAVRHLLTAERFAPDEVRCRPMTHRLIDVLLRTTNGESGRLLRGVAERAGVAA